MEQFLGKPVDRFLAFIEMDRRGVEKLGWFFYTGMGAEVISGLYKATRVNPRMPINACLQRIYTHQEGNDLIYGVELPNVEAGVWSSIEGGVPPTGREVMRIMGITDTREFCANLAAQVMAGEFNLACEIVRGKLYTKGISRLY
jgi:hydroxymethylglutaryl-CoA reductase